jgi:hypothetical protein
LWGSIDVIPAPGTIDAMAAKIEAKRFNDRLT